jgi:hypothetical protein
MLGETASAYGEVWHVPGAGPITGREFIDMAFRAAGNKPNIGLLSGRMLCVAGLVGFGPLTYTGSVTKYLLFSSFYSVHSILIICHDFEVK